MKQSTCRCFHRENEWCRRWKSTRRDTTSAGDRAADPAIGTASAAIAVACASWAWTMSGARRRMTRDSRHAALRSISLRDAIGTSSSPSAARFLSSPLGCATSIVRCPIARRPFTVSSTWFCPPRQVWAVSMWRENISEDSLTTDIRGSIVANLHRRSFR